MTTLDSLAGLPGRVGLNAALNAALLQPGRWSALVCCEVYGLKAVNEAIGHDAGDHLLALVANRIAQLRRPGQMLARLSFDEFAVVIPDAGRRWSTSRYIERFRSVVGAPVCLSDQTFTPDVAVGCHLIEGRPAQPLGAVAAALHLAVGDMYRNRRLRQS